MNYKDPPIHHVICFFFFSSYQPPQYFCSFIVLWTANRYSGIPQSFTVEEIKIKMLKKHYSYFLFNIWKIYKKKRYLSGMCKHLQVAVCLLHANYIPNPAAGIKMTVLSDSLQQEIEMTRMFCTQKYNFTA